MNGFIRDMPLFVEVARLKSFTLAAQALGIGISTLSRRIALLEKRMGVPLFLRNTRNVELTGSGKALYQRCEYLLLEAEQAYETVIRDQNAPAGLLRISLFGDVYHFHLAEALTRFACRWPDLRLHITLNEQPVDLLTEPYDVDIRFGPLADSNLVVRKIYTIRPGVYASPQLLRKFPAPAAPEDLANMPCIFLAGHANTWKLFNGQQQAQVTVRRPAHIVNSVKIWSDFALAGLGVGLLGSVEAARHEKNGALLRLLPEWSAAPIEMYLILANKQLPQRLRLLVDYLADYCASLP